MKKLYTLLLAAAVALSATAATPFQHKKSCHEDRYPIHGSRNHGTNKHRP